jgi:hypothetical protein
MAWEINYEIHSQYPNDYLKCDSVRMGTVGAPLIGVRAPEGEKLPWKLPVTGVEIPDWYCSSVMKRKRWRCSCVENVSKWCELYGIGLGLPAAISE